MPLDGFSMACETGTRELSALDGHRCLTKWSPTLPAPLLLGFLGGRYPSKWGHGLPCEGAYALQLLKSDRTPSSAGGSGIDHAVSLPLSPADIAYNPNDGCCTAWNEAS